ncbi:hypothetical protein [Eubacterium oxidoreducens]|uniref:Uncharacterized protein n=1 Tax=Eubacterium oxidoreducens TaxID=1732 RepID=A0A1G6ALH6_EUBOX|nr:hypothetical protein [Eubacterium oxidoreducens]SDB08983.1 hypothetical protein SAMN02910417_00642 [Eubacterium oxidoreducens]
MLMGLIEITEFREFLILSTLILFWMYIYAEELIEWILIRINKPVEASYGMKRMSLTALILGSPSWAGLFQPRWPIIFVLIICVLLALFVRSCVIDYYVDQYEEGIYTMSVFKRTDQSKVKKKNPEEVVKNWPPRWVYILAFCGPFSIIEILDKLNEMGMCPWATAFIKWFE